MMIVWIFLGLGTGWVIHHLSDYMPRFALRPPARPASGPVPAPLAVGQLFRPDLGQPWIRLDAAVEMGTAVYFAWAWMFYGLSWNLLLHLVAFVFFVLVAVIDIKFRLVLNVLMYPAVVLIVLAQLVIDPTHMMNVLVGGAFAFSIFYGTARIKPEGLGGGDIKLALLIGLLFGFPGVLFALLLGAGATAVFIVTLLVTRRGGLKTHIPYAPFLCFGALAALMLSPLWLGSGVLG
ncbi:MAG: A24 family peptidase [Anaerolineae bacterium]|nr:A24 family peptidase [Anaerolineae bacterium]